MSALRSFTWVSGRGQKSRPLRGGGDDAVAREIELFRRQGAQDADAGDLPPEAAWSKKTIAAEVAAIVKRVRKEAKELAAEGGDFTDNAAEAAAALGQPKLRKRLDDAYWKSWAEVTARALKRAREEARQASVEQARDEMLELLDDTRIGARPKHFAVMWRPVAKDAGAALTKQALSDEGFDTLLPKLEEQVRNANADQILAYWNHVTHV